MCRQQVTIFGTVAQLGEHQGHNLVVMGSSPIRSIFLHSNDLCAAAVIFPRKINAHQVAED